MYSLFHTIQAGSGSAGVKCSTLRVSCVCHGNSLYLTRGFSAHLSWIAHLYSWLPLRWLKAGISLGERPLRLTVLKQLRGKGKAHPHFSGHHLSGTHSFHSILMGQGFLASPRLAVREADDVLWQDSLNFLRENLSRLRHEPLVSVPSTRRSCLNHKRWLGTPMACASRLQPEHPAKIRPRVAGSRFRKAPCWPKGRCWNWPKRPAGPCGRSHQVHP